MDSSANKHKFMVQAIFAPDGEVNQDELVSFEVENERIRLAIFIGSVLF